MGRYLTNALVIIAWLLVAANAHAIVDLIDAMAVFTRENPVDAVAVAAAAAALISLCRFLARLLLRPHYHPSTEREAVATLRELTEDRDPSELENSARHEAAHTLAAYLLGGTHLTADIHRIADRGGQATYRNPPGGTAQDNAYDALVIGVAGQVIDNLNGEYSIGARADMQEQQLRMMTILSIGKTPTRHHGPLTVEALITATRDEAEQLLTSHPSALERITRALLDQHELTDHDIRALAAEPVTAAA